MQYIDGKVYDIKIAYIGGGSRSWARNLMRDLISVNDINGTVALYDVDYSAAQDNAKIGEMYNKVDGALSKWNYVATKTLADALTGADFVVVSILPGTFDEMESDVHTPEKYGIWQSVGDTVGAGGIIRALRTIPMFEEIGKAVKEYCPKAWVINYTNPMTMCVKTLYKAFPEIKAFGCCHEVFGTQRLLASALKEICNEEVKYSDIKVNVTGINHFTWITSAHYKNYDIFDVYSKFCDKYYATGYGDNLDDNWLNKYFETGHRVKMDLFKRYGIIAAAGDRHLAEFCPGDWYLKNPETAHSWRFGLTPVSWRKQTRQKQIDETTAILKGERELVVGNSGEVGVNQIRALIGLTEFITNVNIPNVGQIPNLPLGVVVETNATFRVDEVIPVMAGNLPDNIYPLISRIVAEQEMVVDAGIERNIEKAFIAFVNDPQVRLDFATARKLFDEMIANTKQYLKDYNI